MNSLKNKDNTILKCIFLFILILTSGCKNATKEPQQTPIQKPDKEISLAGNYVSEGYAKRSEGYDWVAVSISEAKNEQIAIFIRSRADKKKPTCTFDAKAEKVDDHLYESQINGKTIQFEFTDAGINITAKNQEDEGLLYFYCNGGASISGIYSKINEPLDQAQIDKTKFLKTLSLQDVGFNISSIDENGETTLTIFTFGLQESEFNETLNIEGEEVVNAEVEDLNADGSPELLIYTRSAGSGSYGNVYAFSVNNKKSISQVYFQPTAENPEISNGYMGHDEFTLVENYLGQRFPIYKDGDTNANPTGGTRQVMYRLVDGEAMRKLEVHSVTDY